MIEWILIVQILTPGGDFIDKMPVTMPSKKACYRALKQMEKPIETDHPLGIKYQGWTCVTRDHYEGRSFMKGMFLD